MKRVLVTGARGFIGRRVIEPLLQRGYEVHAVSSQGGAGAHPIAWHRADLLDAEQVAGLMDNVRATHLLHFAWYAEPGKYWMSPENYRWLEASVRLAREFRRNGGERVVMAGTCAEYDWRYGFCSEQLTPRRPSTPYGVCKNAVQETLASYCESEGVSAAWGRIFFLYGPDEHPARLLASVVDSLRAGRPALCTHGGQIRDFLHVDDVASAFVALLDSSVQGAINIASGRPTAVRDLVLRAAEQLQGRERVQFGALKSPSDEPPLLVGDVRRLAEELKWHPRHDLASGIAHAVSHRPGPGS
jgi:nucleoside-diphosphate-sugar epimerase